MTKPSGPISILCAYDASGIVVPLSVNTDGELLVDTGVPATVDASDVTYTPTTAADWDGGVDPGNQDSANDQLAERVKDLETAVITVDYPVRYSWFHDTVKIVAGNAVNVAYHASAPFYFYAYQNPAANSDKFRISCCLAVGDYTLRLSGFSDTSYGKLDISFKHNLDAGYTNIVTGQDWYAASTVYYTIKTATFSVLTPGRHIFDFTVNGKNASSSGYIIALTKADIYLTAGDS